MALTFTVDGGNYTAFVDESSWAIGMDWRSPWTASFITNHDNSTSSALRPQVDKTVVVTDGATTIFRGWIYGVVDEAIAPPARGTKVRVQCRSTDAVLDWTVVNKTYGTDPLGIANSSVAASTSITTVQPHGYVTGDRVFIEGHEGSTPALDGTHVCTVTSHSTFTIPVTVTVSGGGGTVRKVVPADQVVADLHASYLTSFMTLDTLSTAADLTKQVYKDATLREVLDKIAQLTGWIYRVTPAPQLQFFASGTKTSSFNLSAATAGTMGLSWEQRQERYYNHIYLHIGADGTKAKEDVITGDGATNNWLLKYKPAVNANGIIVSQGYVNENNHNPDYPLTLLSDIVSSSIAVNTTITTVQPHGLDPATTHTVVIQAHSGSTPAISGSYTATVTGLRTFTIPVTVTVAGTGGSVYESGYTWLYYPTTNSLFRVGALGNKVVALFSYSAQFPLTVEASSGLANRSAVFTAPDIWDVDAGQAMAAAILRRYSTIPKSVSISTRVGFIMPGDRITLTFADRLVTGNYLVQTVTAKACPDRVMEYAFTAVDSEFRDSALDIQRDALSGGGLQNGGGTITGGIVPAPSGMAIDNIVAKAGDLVYEMEIGNVTGGVINSQVTGIRFGRQHFWVMGERPKQSPGTGAGNEFVWFDTKLSTTDPLLRFVDDGVNVIVALNATFTATRGVQLGEDASGKRFAAGHFINQKITGAWTLQGTEVLTGVITPSQITADQNNYAPTGIADARIVRLSSDTTRSITGITNSVNGNVITLWNVGAQTINLLHASGSSSAGNQFLCPGGATFPLHAEDCVDIIYDTTSSRWRIQGY